MACRTQYVFKVRGLEGFELGLLVTCRQLLEIELSRLAGLTLFT